ncbi:uncharacterized protein LOC129587975 isoform X2 [Paramacrobiotus metropolitanus]|nr:uncharacterized protein LOC129587975 isoform X2 [Paramacrobiotus metropolitanus]
MTTPAYEHKPSLPEVFPLRRGTVLANADFQTLEVWEEDAGKEADQQPHPDDYTTADDYDVDDSLRYTTLTAARQTVGDLWDRLRCRRFYRIEGDKFYLIRTLSVRRGTIIDMCQHAGHPYIVKRIPINTGADLVKAADQFNNLRNYDHPHVCFAYKAGIGNAPTWRNWSRTEVRFLLPFINGHLLSVELADRRREQRYIHPRRIVRLLREMLDGLFEIHSHSYGDAHRDIRPETIMIRTPDDWPVLLDLDACTPAVIITTDEEEVANMVDISENVTSPFYRAPETYDIKPESVIDERTDIWAMGCTLFAMCFFRSPFQPPDVDDTFSPLNIPEPVRQAAKDLTLSLTAADFLDNVIPADSPYPRQLHEFMARMLSVDLNSRPTTEQIIRELDEMIAALGGPDQPICVKYPWINPAADEMAADVIKRRTFAPRKLQFDEMYPELAGYVYMEDRARSFQADSPKDQTAGILESLRLTGGNFLFSKSHPNPYAVKKESTRRKSLLESVVGAVTGRTEGASERRASVASGQKPDRRVTLEPAQAIAAEKTPEARLHVHGETEMSTIVEDAQEHALTMET